MQGFNWSNSLHARNKCHTYVGKDQTHDPKPPASLCFFSTSVGETVFDTKGSVARLSIHPPYPRLKTISQYNTSTSAKSGIPLGNTLHAYRNLQ